MVCLSALEALVQRTKLFASDMVSNVSFRVASPVVPAGVAAQSSPHLSQSLIADFLPALGQALTFKSVGATHIEVQQQNPRSHLRLTIVRPRSLSTDAAPAGCSCCRPSLAGVFVESADATNFAIPARVR
jgi:hypothetical protein